MHLQYPLFALLFLNQIDHFLLLVQGPKEGNLALNSGIHLASVIDEIGFKNLLSLVQKIDSKIVQLDLLWPLSSLPSFLIFRSVSLSLYFYTPIG